MAAMIILVDADRNQVEKLVDVDIQDEDWEENGVVNKKVYCLGDDSLPFWEGIGIHWSKHWDLGYTKLIVLGGDDASWIDEGGKIMHTSVKWLSSVTFMQTWLGE